MADTHVWLRNPSNGIPWRCPVKLRKHFEARGFEACDAPEETDQHLYDDPEDPRVDPTDSPAPEPVEKPTTRRSGDSRRSTKSKEA